MSEGLIYAAMSGVMADVGVVGKAKKNAQQGYQFRGIDDVAAAVQGALVKHGVICVPRVVHHEREVMTTKSGGSMVSVRLLVEHTFYAKDGSSVTATTLGEAMDSGDKASNKAMSAALKYALTESLMIPTYEADRDTEEASPELDSDPIAREVEALRRAIQAAKSEADLDALRLRLRALPASDGATLRAPFDARMKAVKP